jgi:hypothetical protein
MRRTVIACVLTALVTAMLVTGAGHQPMSAPVAAQATTTKTDLISNYRANANAFLTWKDANKALRAQYDALAYSWADGDFTNANAGITAAQFTTAVTNLSLVQAAFDNGATLASGFPATIYRIK